MFSIVVQNANASDKDSFRNIIIENLKKVVKEKIDREALQGSINRMEFRLREGDDAQKGIAYNVKKHDRAGFLRMIRFLHWNMKHS